MSCWVKLYTLISEVFWNVTQVVGVAYCLFVLWHLIKVFFYA